MSNSNNNLQEEDNKFVKWGFMKDLLENMAVMNNSDIEALNRIDSLNNTLLELIKVISFQSNQIEELQDKLGSLMKEEEEEDVLMNCLNTSLKYPYPVQTQLDFPNE